MEDFQKSLLRLMTSNLGESERIQLIGQLQFAIVLLEKQQQQFEEKKAKERDLQLSELRQRANGLSSSSTPPPDSLHSHNPPAPHKPAPQPQQTDCGPSDCLPMLTSDEISLQTAKHETANGLQVLSQPPHDLLQPYFGGEEEGEFGERWTGHKVEVELHESLCAPEIEVVQLGSGKTGEEETGGGENNGPMLLPVLYTGFSESPRDEDDPLLAPITLEAEEMGMREDNASDSELGGPGGAPGFPPLRVSLRSKRKARKPRRMTPQEANDEEDMLSPYHVCPVCDLVWRRSNEYVAHLLSHAPAPVTCAACKGTFENTALLKSHECFDPDQALFFRRLCGYCGAGFVNKKAFNRHKRTTHAFATAINCNLCQRTFYDSKQYYSHLESSHVAKGFRVCRRCGHLLDSDSALRQHMRTAHGRPGPVEAENGEGAGAGTKGGRNRRLPFKCSYCAAQKRQGDGADTVVAFPTRAALTEHVNTAHQIRCDDCGKNFRSAVALHKHRQVSHSQPSPVKRRRVAKQHELEQEEEEEMTTDAEEEEEEEEEEVTLPPSTSSAPRQRRQKRLPTPSSKSTNQRRAARSRARARRQCQHQLNGYKCRFCTARFHAYSVYREHLQLNHADQVKAGECSDCQQVFLSQSSLEKHRTTRTHRQRTGEVRLERRHLCELCGKAYLRQQALQRHMKTHINDYEFCCPHCEFKAVEKSNLKAHLSRHFDIKPFACDKCDAKFTSRRSLKDHFKFKHSDARDYFCETCGMGFKTLGTLSRHKKGHSTEKPYACFCGVQFNRLSNLRRHLKSVHQTDDTVLPVKRLKKFNNGVDSGVQYVASPAQQPPPASQQESLVSLHMSNGPASPPPASVMDNLAALPPTPPAHSPQTSQPPPPTPPLPSPDDDSTHAVLHSFLTSEQPPNHDLPPPGPLSNLLVHNSPPTSQPALYTAPQPSSPPSGSMLRSLVAPPPDIWRPMNSDSVQTTSSSAGMQEGSCSIVSSVNCVLDAPQQQPTCLPFDDVLWSSAVLPQTSAGPSHTSNITHLLSAACTSHNTVALHVGQTDNNSSMLFGQTPGQACMGPVVSSGGELTSTLMISHLAADPLPLHALSSNTLVSPTLQHPIHQQHMQHTDTSNMGHVLSNHPHPSPHPHPPQQPQTAVPTSGHQCSDFSVCYLIGGHTHVK